MKPHCNIRENVSVQICGGFEREIQNGIIYNGMFAVPELQISEETYVNRMG